MASTAKLSQRHHAADLRPPSPRIAAHRREPAYQADGLRAEALPATGDCARLAAHLATLTARHSELAVENMRLAAENRKLAAAGHAAYHLTQQVEGLRKQKTTADASLAQAEGQRRGRSRSPAASHRFCATGSVDVQQQAARGSLALDGSDAAPQALDRMSCAAVAQSVSAADAGGSGMSGAVDAEPAVVAAHSSEQAGTPEAHGLDNVGASGTAGPNNAAVAARGDAMVAGAVKMAPELGVLMLRAELREKDDLLRVTRRQLEVRSRLRVNDDTHRHMLCSMRSVQRLKRVRLQHTSYRAARPAVSSSHPYSILSLSTCTLSWMRAFCTRGTFRRFRTVCIAVSQRVLLTLRRTPSRGSSSWSVTLGGALSGRCRQRRARRPAGWAPRPPPPSRRFLRSCSDPGLLRAAVRQARGPPRRHRRRRCLPAGLSPSMAC